MKKYIFIVTVVLTIYSCKSLESNRPDKTVLFTIDEKPVTNEEFLYVYQKNNFNDTLPLQQSIDHYLDLFIKFKLKVAEARQRGMHNTQEFIQEFETYKEQLTEPYLKEKDVTDKLIKEAYNRLKEEVNASHMLIQLPSPAMPEDTLQVYNQLMSIRERVVAGEDFAELAKEFSQDPSAKTNGGNLGYFSALQMVYPFEEMAFTTPEGEVSLPFRTRFGYHILQVHDRRASQGQVKVSHIMIRATEGLPIEDSLQARQKINHIYQQLENGTDWNKLVQQYSEDLNTKNSGGALPWLSTGNIHPSFAKEAFALENKGDYSKPVKTPYGWHIIRLEEKKSLEPLHEMEASLRGKIEKDSRSQLQKSHLISRLKEENNFKEVSSLNALEPDSSLLKGNWQPQKDTLNPLTLFTIAEEPYNQNQFFDYVLSHQKPQQGITAKYYLQLLYEEFIDESLVEYEKSHLAEKYPDYRLLLQEYEEGILLFQLMDDQVWSKAAEDTTGLREFFTNNTQNYRWNERASLLMLQANNKNTLDSALAVLPQRFYAIPELDFTITEKTNLDLILNRVAREVENNPDRHVFINSSEEANQKISSYLLERGISDEQLHFQDSDQPSVQIRSKSKKALSLRFPGLLVEEGAFERSGLPILAKSKWLPGVEQLVEDGNYYYIDIKEILKPRPKQLNEIKGKVIADYQDYLEKNWVEELRQKYSVEVNERARKKLYRQLDR